MQALLDLKTKEPGRGDADDETPKSGHERMQRVFWTKGAEVSQETSAPYETSLHQSKRFLAPLAQKTSCTLS